MPRYYCDYCDVYLTHDSAPGRAQHNRGGKHREFFKAYYQKVFEEQQRKQAEDRMAACEAAEQAGRQLQLQNLHQMQQMQMQMQQTAHIPPASGPEGLSAPGAASIGMAPPGMSGMPLPPGAGLGLPPPPGTGQGLPPPPSR
jgi:U1 small nuclear ribonucleoprotein C